MATQKDPNSGHYDMGVDAAIKSGNTDRDGNQTSSGVGPVWYDDDLVGAGPDPSTANGLLFDWRRPGTHGINLWISDFSADFSVTGVTAQSHLKRDFFPRYFTQPEYVVQGQCANNYELNRLARYIRASQINQIAGLPPEGANTNDLLQLTLKGDHTPAGRSTKGGNKPWTMIGYIKATTAGAQRFVTAPAFTFNFVLIDATEGVLKDLDSLLLSSRSGFANGYSQYIEQFGASIADPNIPAPKPWGADTGKPTKPPSKSDQVIQDANAQVPNTATDNLGNTLDYYLGND